MWGIRISCLAYTLFCIGYGTFRNTRTLQLNQATGSVIYQKYFGYTLLPYIALVTFLNASLLYYGYCYVVPNELKTGVSNSRLLALFNMAAFFAVVVEAAFILQTVVLFNVKSSFYLAHSGICAASLLIGEYCMDHGIFARYSSDIWMGRKVRTCRIEMTVKQTAYGSRSQIIFEIHK